MARTSKYTIDPAAAIKAVRWQAALYVRLSREDGDKEESDSIGNQRVLLREFAEREPDIDVREIYIDDGYSGTHFDRPEFLRMIDAVKQRAVNCVIVKDLSRFGRNYIEVGNYIEKVFPFLDVRFISVNDSLDSYRSPQSMNNLVVPFKNILNDEYCRDISNKVRSALDIKRRQGKFIGSFAAYGYQKDPADKGRLIVDETPAAVVRDIYSWFLRGMSIIGIAKKLNEQGVLNPTAYKISQGFQYRHPAGEKNDKLWPDSSVRRILTNKLYTGTMVQGKNKIKSYKVPVSVPQPCEQWIEVENTHEAIVDLETFEKVQGLLKRDTRTSPQERRVHLFSGFVRCYDCGRAMNRKLISQPYRDYHYYVCSTFKKMNKGACTKHAIRGDRLEEAVYATIRRHIDMAVSISEVVEEVNRRGASRLQPDRLIKALGERTREKVKIERMKLALYPDWKNGDISKEEYMTLKEQFEAELEGLTRSIENLQKDIDRFTHSWDGTLLSDISKFVQFERLTREMIVELIDCVYVHEGGGITIQFKFEDEFEKALEYVGGNQIAQ